MALDVDDGSRSPAEPRDLLVKLQPRWFGVSATRHGQSFEYDARFERADAALYEANHAGRKRVISAPA